MAACTQCGTELSVLGLCPRCVVVTISSESDSTIVKTGMRLGPYEVLSPLGRGGMAEVYLARDTRLGRTVALKIFTSWRADDDESRRRIEREAQAIASLAHPHICALYDIGHQDELDFLVMEYLQGETLSQRLERGALPIEEALQIAVEISDALHAAHGHGIIHRDLKPANVMLTGSGAKLLDFGVAKLRASGPVVSDAVPTANVGLATTDGLIVGTLQYMAPEQLQGKALDGRTDIFALGLILFEMATGQRAFQANSQAELIAAILESDPPSVVSVRRETPSQLDAVVRRCVAKNPAQRFGESREVARALQPILARARAKRDAFGLRTYSVVAALLLLGLVVGIMGQRYRRGTAYPSPLDSVAVLPLQNLSSDPSQDYFADAMTEALITELSRIQALRVVSRTSVMQFKGTHKALPEIAKALNVSAVVEGSVIRVDNRVRITAQLIRGQSDEHLWGESYDREMKDVLVLQSAIAETIAAQIGVKLSPQEANRFRSPRHKVDPEAYEAYLRGRMEMEKNTGRAWAFFKTAIEKDPNYADAWAGRAEAEFRGVTFIGVPPAEKPHFFDLARASAQRALELDSSLPAVHLTLALFHREQCDWSEAEREYRLALALNPGDADAHSRYGEYLRDVRLNPVDALAEGVRAQKLDPLSPEMNGNLAILLCNNRRYEEAIKQAQKTLDMYPSEFRGHAALGCAYEKTNRFDDAIAEFEEGNRIAGSRIMFLAWIGHAYAVAGRTADALAVIDEIRRRARGDLPPDEGTQPKFKFLSPDLALEIEALVYEGLGEIDQTVRLLDQALPVRACRNLGFLEAELTDPSFERLQAHPAFADFLRRKVIFPP
jgi:serine/threonine protein kinase/tetratricopeptide (TPR) repeat protein